MMQTVSVAVFVTAALAYAGWRVFRLVSHYQSPCYGCEGCALKGVKEKTLKKQTCEKKTGEKFGQSK